MAIVAIAFIVLSAAQALAGHCINTSKKDDAGNHTNVIVNAITDQVTVDSLNGGYADVWLDVDGDGTGDILLEEDVQIGRNHSPNWDEAAEAWVNPGAINKTENPNATDDEGMVIPHTD